MLSAASQIGASDGASPATAAESHSNIERDIVKAFGSFGLGVEAVGTIEGLQVTRVRLKPASGVKVASPKTCRWRLPWISQH